MSGYIDIPLTREEVEDVDRLFHRRELKSNLEDELGQWSLEGTSICPSLPTILSVTQAQGMLRKLHLPRSNLQTASDWLDC